MCPHRAPSGAYFPILSFIFSSLEACRGRIYSIGMDYCSDINIGPGLRICEERAPVELIRRIKSEVEAFKDGILKVCWLKSQTANC